MKRLLTLPSVLLVSLVLGACSFTIDGDGGGSSSTSFSITINGQDVSNFKETASRDEDIALDVREGDTVVLEDFDGPITIRASDTDEPTMQAHLVAAAETPEEAQAILDASEIVVERKRKQLVVRLVRPENAVNVYFDGMDRAKYSVFLPTMTSLEAATVNGHVEVTGPFGSSKLRSSYGDVDAVKIKGDVDVSSSSGDLRLEDIEGDSVLANSNYGDVELRSIEARSIDARSSSGTIELENARADSTTLKSSYGPIRVDDLEGSLDANTSSGKVDVKSVHGKSIKLHSSYGTITTRDTRGELTLTASSGKLDVEGQVGPVSGESNYGSVTLAGIFSDVNAKSSSGAVEVTAKGGSKLEDGWKLHSGYGNVVLYVPADTAFDVDAKTNYGKVHCDFPALVEAGQVTNQKAFRGAVNGGGPEIRLTTSSGSIKIKKSDD